jgi:eukaryotic-like serine/threonine-protein kinase
VEGDAGKKKVAVGDKSHPSFAAADTGPAADGLSTGCAEKPATGLPGTAPTPPTVAEKPSAPPRPPRALSLDLKPFSDTTATLPGLKSAITGVRPAGTIIGSYKLIEILGEGGMGYVYLAEHTRLGRKVALKLLRNEYASNATAVHRFFTEACAVNQICHENIVEITDFIENEGGDSYCIMELLRGKTLQDALKEEEVLPISRALGIAVQVARALAAVHEAGIVHRDLKPANIFLTNRSGQRDFVKLLDFGIAKLSDEMPNISSGHTSPGAILGTPEYMSAEQASGKPATFRADLYSFGVILYEMVTGKKPHTGKSLGELVIKHLTVVPVRPSRVRGVQKLPPELDQLIVQCLEKEPANRPRDMLEVAERLRRIASEESVELETYASRRRPRFSRREWFAAGAVGITLVATTTIALLLRAEGPPRSPTVPPQASPAPPRPSTAPAAPQSAAAPHTDASTSAEPAAAEPAGEDAAVVETRAEPEEAWTPRGAKRPTKKRPKKVEEKIFRSTVDPFKEKRPR